MKKIIVYKWWLVIGLFIIPITFLLLITALGMIINLVQYSDFSFSLLTYWNNCFNNWYFVVLALSISLISYIYYGYKVCFTKKQEPKLKATKQNDYGSAQWLSKKAIKQLYPLVNSNSKYSHHGFVVNSKLVKGALCHNLRTNTHSLVIGGTGSGKTQGLVLPTININSKSQVKPSMIITDVKGELYQSQSKLLQKQGYNIKVLNLRNIKKSIAWNPLQIIYDQFKLMLLTKSEKNKLYLKVQIQSDIQDLTKALFANNTQSDSFWSDSGALITEAIILGILEEAETRINKYHIQDSKAIKELLATYLPVNKFNLASVTVIASSGKDMISWFKSFPDSSIAKLTAHQVFHNGSKTLMSILMTMATHLAIFKNDFIRNLTCQNDLLFHEFITKATVLFIVVPDENHNYYLFVTLLIMQLYKFLVSQANKNKTGSLKKPVYFLCDEFGNLPRIPNIAIIITIARSRNIFFQLIVQDLQQLKEKYNSEVANIIFTNCSLHIFLQTIDLATAEKYSKMIGDTTVVQVATNKSKELRNQSETLAGHPLILASDLMKLAINQAIVFYPKENPFKATLIPWYQVSLTFHQENVKLKSLKLINFKENYYYDIKRKVRH